jgi:ribose-phosphate pyrophosphokinase
MFTFLLPPFDSESNPIVNTQLGSFQLIRFSNQELHIHLDCDVRDKKCLIVGSISPPDTQFFTYMSLIHTLKKNGATECVAILPYLSYARQEHEEPKQSQMAALVFSLLEKSGADQIIAFDIHSKKAQSLFSIPVHEIQSASLFASYLLEHHIPFDSCISPDMGGIERSVHLADLLHIPRRGYFKKIRSAASVELLEFHGDVGKKILIVDDVVDTGSTLLKCVEALHTKGVLSITIAVTHPLFSENKTQELYRYGVDKIICLSTIPLPDSLKQDPRILCLPIFEVLNEVIWKKN